jgi:hypothetical protein
MRRIILSSVACPALQHFPTYHKRHDFRKGVIEHVICVFDLRSIFLSDTYLLRTERDISVLRSACKVYLGHHIKYPFFLEYFNETCSL